MLGKGELDSMGGSFQTRFVVLLKMRGGCFELFNNLSDVKASDFNQTKALYRPTKYTHPISHSLIMTICIIKSRMIPCMFA